ncbi:MAG: YebC/PmpR family DNA-binding transcriptional regulator [Cyanobacteria bacterium]|nr:YebC/PmpR family DNA-binding transcriptional regulator [Cyanobacteriota bacterium]
MAGHSKWANIKRRKAAQDAKKGQAYAKFSREIIVAARIGGGDPAGNFRLRTAIERGKAAGLPNDNIQRAIDKGVGSGASDQLENLNYEGYGPAGVAVFIESMTDNRNRTAGDIRSYFNKYNGNLGSDGCVAWIFQEQGLITVETHRQKRSYSEESLFEAAIDAGASDFVANTEENLCEIFTEPDRLNTVCEGLSESGWLIQSAEMTRRPQNTVEISDTAQAVLLMKLLDAIENQEDVQAVYANAVMEDAVTEAAWAVLNR